MNTRQNRENRTTTMSALGRLSRLLAPWHQPDATPSHQMLGALNANSKHIYAGTVPPQVIARRRARNKMARMSRRTNR